MEVVDVYVHKNQIYKMALQDIINIKIIYKYLYFVLIIVLYFLNNHVVIQV